MKSNFLQDLKYLIENRPDIKIIGVGDKTIKDIYFRDCEGFIHKMSRFGLVKGDKPSQKSVLDKDEYYKNRLNKVHNGKYDYSLVSYIHKEAKIKIICPEHGIFEQRGSDHLYGAGCPKCAFRLRKGYTKTQWIDCCKKYKHYINTIYILKCFNEEEAFIKIGITSKTVKERFSGLFAIPYNYRIIKEFKYIPEIAYDKEKELHKKYKKYKYNPSKLFGGRKECFSIEILNDFVS